MIEYEKVCLKTRQKYMCSYIIPISQGQFAVNFRGNSCGMEYLNCRKMAAVLCKFFFQITGLLQECYLKDIEALQKLKASLMVASMGSGVAIPFFNFHNSYSVYQ